MHLDHLSYVAGPDGLGACAQWLGSRLGAGFHDGGLHPAFGTRNFVLPLAGGAYLEVVKALDHPAADRAPFGRAVSARSAAGGGWLAWAIRVDDITTVERQLDRAAAPGHRRRPDGFDLRWKQIGLHDVAQDPQLPFFVEWESDAQHHPSGGGSAVTLRSIEICGDETVVDSYLGTSSRQPLDGLDVTWLPPDDGETGVVAATFDTPHGEVRID
ncbi:VOC family protein [uncultured Jatrophihabitans sp.]|uniref:VOC family protein n=1 Tax=uncultured Jatrophihabitans sp. TaxID=1610747 RepID=UPI0035C9BA37